MQSVFIITFLPLLAPALLTGSSREDRGPLVQVVVAAWRENLTFLEPMLRRVPGAQARIYCAGEHIQDSRCHPITNYGSENYAYLKHIVDHYDKGLAAVTVFTMGSVMKKEWDFLLCRKLNYVLSAVDPTEKQRRFPGYVTMANMAPGQFLPFNDEFDIKTFRAFAGGQARPLCRASSRPLQKWYQKFVGPNLTRARLAGVQYNGIFAASRGRIKAWPRSVYEGLLHEMERCGPGVPHVAGHYMERAWKAMLDPTVAGGPIDDHGPNECPIKDIIRRSTAVAWLGLSRGLARGRDLAPTVAPLLLQTGATPGRCSAAEAEDDDDEQCKVATK
mmetsp:Transcript_43501/g.117320  ORF Transcript_43501/g.117320 Transcript_43501/m.117320 type:complete len:332 (-) Transcript_43501:30-1025(-)